MKEGATVIQAEEANGTKFNQQTNNAIDSVILPEKMLSDMRYIALPKKDDKIQVDVLKVEDKDPMQLDPWALPEFKIETVNWQALTTKQKIYKILIDYIGKFLLLITLLYLFICSLDLLSSAFQLLGGKAAGKVFQENKLLNNNIAGLMIGVLVTVLLQSSSTTTSIIVTMVASGILQVKPAIPIIMGANIGTSITNTIVSIAQSGDKDEFRRAFAAATLHDMFNWLTVFVLLPLESFTGFLYYTTESIVTHFKIGQMQDDSNKEILSKLTKPFTKLFIVLDKNVIKDLAEGKINATSISLIKKMCPSPNKALVKGQITDIVPHLANVDDKIINGTTALVPMGSHLLNAHLVKCKSLFSVLGWNDAVVGTILLVLSLCLLCTCLICMVKVLHSMLKGKIAVAIRKTVNSDFPPPFSFLTGYVAILIGAGVTFMVQSSSIFTSALTPLVGIGVVTLDRVYPLTLGSNLGTTATGILASLTASAGMLKYSLQIALCHLFFNLIGILLWYPLPFMRFPITLAKILGNTTAKYRWFAVFYLVVAFFIIPGAVFAISSIATLFLPNNSNASSVLIFTIFGSAAAILVLILVINLLQRKRPAWLPQSLRNWERLPRCMHSLAPLDSSLRCVSSKITQARTKLFPGKPSCSSTQQNGRAGLDKFSSTNALIKISNGGGGSFYTNSNASSFILPPKESPISNRIFANMYDIFVTKSVSPQNNTSTSTSTQM